MTRYPLSYQNGGKIAKIDTLFMSKTAEKTLPFGAAYTYIAHIREYPPPPGEMPCRQNKKIVFHDICCFYK